MSKTFPENCTKECPYYHSWDLSIDDYTNVCDKLHVQVDDCDAYGPLYVPILCPLDEKELEESEEDMEAQHSEQYYRDNWERFIKKSPESDYMNLEEELNHQLCIFDTDTAEKLRPIYAKIIYEKAIDVLKRRMITVENLKSGKSSLGYVNQSQEIREMHRLVQRFEFNCLQAKYFKEKYSIEV